MSEIYPLVRNERYVYIFKLMFFAIVIACLDFLCIFDLRLFYCLALRILHETSSSSLIEEREETMQKYETTCETNNIHVDEFEDSLLFEQVRDSVNYL